MIYLNNAATSWPKAPGVAGAVSSAILSPPPGDGRATASGGSTATDCRRLLSSLLSLPDFRRIILTSNATQALNTAILGFPWKSGDFVITTQAEHNSVLRPLFRLKKQGIIDYTALPVCADGRVDPTVWRSALAKYRPRLAVFTHASNVSGAVNDARLLSSEAKSAGASVLIDASQTCGLVPVLPLEWGADMLALTGHKYLLGPLGTGALYVAPGTELSPVYTGGTGIRSDEDEMPEALPLRLEAGTGNAHSFAGLASAISYANENPLDSNSLSAKLLALEHGMLRLGMNPISVSGERTPVISAKSPLYPADILGEMLNSYDIVCRTGLHCAPYYPAIPGGTVRFSMSRFTTDEEIALTLEALEEIHRE